MKPWQPPLGALGLSIAAHALLLSLGAGGASAPQAKMARSGEAGRIQWRWIDAGHQAGQPPKATGRLGQATASAQAAVGAKTGRLADAPARLSRPLSAPDLPSAPLPPEHFWLPQEVDRRALPLQAPDASMLNGIEFPAAHPLRLRLSITSQGVVVDMATLDADPPSSELLAALSTMFRATRFMPARRQGLDVASQQDIEIEPELISQ